MGMLAVEPVGVLTRSEGGPLTLPEGEKDDRLDHEELEHGVVRDEQFTRGEVEEEESVERQTDGDVVDNGHIQVATSHTGWERHRKKCQETKLEPFKLSIKEVELIYNQLEATQGKFMLARVVKGEYIFT